MAATASRWSPPRPSKKDVPVDVPAIGNVEASTTISVRSQVSGVLRRRSFTKATSSRPTSTCSPSMRGPTRRRSSRREANLKRDEALLAQAEAQLKRDRRQRRILADDRRAQQRAGRARHRLEGRRRAGARRRRRARAATVAADKAAVESARAQLGAQAAAVDNAKVAAQLHDHPRRRSTAAPAT